ncbi:MAG: hypothetical protein K0R63_1010 [Rickettsiales bacterium]|jgi:hypothetical protein|nr:hypothetical protein [Rickettsiales bacterium]
MLNISQKIFAEKTSTVVYLTSSNEKGTDFYFYVSIRADRLPAFQQALKQGNFRAEEYGTILAWGYGKPPEEVVQEMATHYGCKPESAISLLSN